MKIGILKTGPVPDALIADFGEYHDMFEAMLAPYGFDFQVWSVVDGDFPQSLEDADGWLITGSRHGVYEDHPWLPPLEQCIRDIFAAGRPLIGVCFGHQVIAQALGGRVEKYAGGWAIGPKVYHFPDGPRVIQAWHQDQVIAPPEGAVTLAHSDMCEHAALLYPGKAFTVQPHPEFDDGFIQGLMDHRAKGVVPDDVLAEAQGRMGKALDRDAMAAMFAKFFREKEIS
ncbi:type 1 glutamine amidotransferase [Sagittula salina]|uniref:Type 1 glutamine amidotransferase n=1 Tax=Sagittula salina TaxID=2820268 RepID=A0A940S1R8_9RHOB|nr:type 1 glutamine amidotransferase [Sagittula salina]MBP0481234.1 type 1 glutamine amidotransferase [Sagittula salina]